MITGISIENFKGIRERVTLEFRPITLLFGANSAGKSTVVHALHYAREIFERHNLDADQTIAGGKYVDLGGFRNFIHRSKPHGALPDGSINVMGGYGGGLADGSGYGMGEGYGGGTADGSGYGDGRGGQGDGRNVSSNIREVRIGISIALTDSDLPEYREPEDYNLYDPEQALFAGIREAHVEVTIAWSDFLNAAHVTEYSVHFNGDFFAKITSQPGRPIPVLETLNLEHSILPKGKDLERFADEFDDGNYSGLKFLLNKVRRNNGAPAWQGDTFYIYESLSGQSDALPIWERCLPFTSWRDDGVDDEPLEPADREAFNSDNREINATLNRLLVGPGQLIRDSLRKFRYLGPLRETPPREFSPPRFPDPARWATGLGAWDTLFNGSDKLVDAVGEWLGAPQYLNAGCRVERRTYLELDYGDPMVRMLMAQRAFDDSDEHVGSYLANAPTTSRIVVVTDRSDIELRPHDVGIGISQVVPVLVTALDGEDGLQAIEQPELHIHPRLQAAIADLFVDAIATHKHRFIIETHSEHLILRLLRRIRETETGKAPEGRQLRTDDLTIHYLKQENGATTATQIDVDVKGEFIQPWPDDFFEIDFFERFPDAR